MVSSVFLLLIIMTAAAAADVAAIGVVVAAVVYFAFVSVGSFQWRLVTLKNLFSWRCLTILLNTIQAAPRLTIYILSSMIEYSGYLKATAQLSTAL